MEIINQIGSMANIIINIALALATAWALIMHSVIGEWIHFVKGCILRNSIVHDCEKLLANDDTKKTRKDLSGIIYADVRSYFTKGHNSWMTDYLRRNKIFTDKELDELRTPGE